MRTLKKSLALVLALVMVLGLGVVGASADNALDNYTDTGDIGDAYLEAVGVLTGLGIVDGMTDTTIEPDGTYTRAQAAKIVATMLLGVDAADSLKATTAPFEDVPTYHWASGYIAYCVEAGIIDGMTATTFEPEGTLTGFQWAKMLLSAVGFGVNGEFEGDSWSLNTATVGHQSGLFSGDLDGADHVALRREQAMLYAFNALTKLPQVTYSKENTNYLYGILGYFFADGTGKTLGDDTFDLRSVEGQIIDNEAMGNANTVVDPVSARARNVSIDADTGLDLMYHAVRAWYVEGKTNTNVYVYDLAKTTVYECMNIAAGDKEAAKLKNVETPSIGYDTDKVEYETYLIDNTALDLANDYAYVSLYADYGTLGRAGSKTTNVDGTAVDNDIILTDISEIGYGAGIIYVKAESALSDGEAWHVWATTGTEGVVTEITKDGNAVVSVTLSDGTVLEMSSFWNQTAGVDGETFVINRNYKFVLDTHGDVVRATRNYARDLYYYTGDSRPAYEFNSWSSDHTTEYRFINVSTGDEYIVPLTASSVADLDANCYYDISANANSSGAYTAEKVTRWSNPYTEQYVIDNFELTKQTNSVWTVAASWDIKDHVVYFDADEITYIVAKGHGKNMTVEEYAGYDELKEAYGLALDSGFIFNNACFTVSDTKTNNKYSDIVFIHEDNLAAYSSYLFVPEDIDVDDWNHATGDAEDYTFKYDDVAYLDGEKVDISFSYSQCVDVNGNTILERGFYTYKFANGVYSLIERMENDVDGHAYYQNVIFTDTNVRDTWLFNGYTAVEGETVVVDCTGEYDELTLEQLYEYYTDPTDGVNLRLAFTVNPANDHVSFVYVVEKGWQSTVTFNLTNELKEAGWKVVGDNVYEDVVSYPVSVTIAKSGYKLTADDISVISETEGWTAKKFQVNVDGSVTIWVEPDWSLAERDDTVILGLKPLHITYSTDDSAWTLSDAQDVVPGNATVLTCSRNDDGMRKSGTLYVILDDTLKGNDVVKSVNVSEGQKTVEVVLTPTDWANYTVSFSWDAPTA